MRHAECQCGQLKAACEGEPVRVSACHCLACQRRTGSAFSAQARFPADKVTVSGEARVYVRIADSGHRSTSHFCPRCGSTVWYENEDLPGIVAVPLGAFADPTIWPPKHSVYEQRRQPWTAILGEDVARLG